MPCFPRRILTATKLSWAGDFGALRIAADWLTQMCLAWDAEDACEVGIGVWATSVMLSNVPYARIFCARVVDRDRGL